MAEKAPRGKAALAAEEARLARGAAAGDGRAFAKLYERYEKRAYNLAYRITGSEPDAADATRQAFLETTMRWPKSDGVPDFGSCLITATRNTCHDQVETSQPIQPGEAGPGNRQEGVRDANLRLPERQREALALRELEGLSYDEIAAIIEVNPDSVAKLIYRGRVNLSDELHGTALAAVAAPSPECERALPLIAARQDGQLEAGSADDAWLDAHLRGCERCRLGVDAMEEADASYRAWAPIAVLPWLLEETMAKGATLAGADWSEEIAEAIASHNGSPTTAGTPHADSNPPDGGGWSPRRRRVAAAAGLAALLAGGGIAAALVGGEPSAITPEVVADSHSAATPPRSKPSSKRQKEGRGHAGTVQTESFVQTTTAASPLAPIETGGGGSSEPAAAPDHQGVAEVQPPQAAASPKPKPKPKPTTPSQPAPAPAPTAEAQPPEPPPEEPAPEHPSKGRGPPPGVPKGSP